MIRQKKSLSQVFLKDANILNKIVRESHIRADEDVVEVGCGEGGLSERIAPLCRHLDIIEIDEAFLEVTRTLLSGYSNVRFIHADVLRAGFDAVEAPVFKLLSNLPYHISAKFVQLMTGYYDRISEAVIMFHDAFADKLTAGAGAPGYTSLSVYAHFYWDIKVLFDVSRNCFRPVPKVDSAVVRFTPRQTPLFDVNTELFFAIVRSAFWVRRKTLRNSLEGSPFVTLAPEFRNVPFFEEFPLVRGEKLALPDFYRLYLELQPFVKTYLPQ